MYYLTLKIHLKCHLLSEDFHSLFYERFVLPELLCLMFGLVQCMGYTSHKAMQRPVWLSLLLIKCGFIYTFNLKQSYFLWLKYYATFSYVIKDKLLNKFRKVQHLYFCVCVCVCICMNVCVHACE